MAASQTMAVRAQFETWLLTPSGARRLSDAEANAETDVGATRVIVGCCTVTETPARDTGPEHTDGMRVYVANLWSEKSTLPGTVNFEESAESAKKRAACPQRSSRQSKRT